MSSVQESFLSYLKSSWSPFSEELIINPLYVIPVLSVLALCLLVYAIGVRSSSAVPPTLALLRDDHKHVQKKLQSNKKPNNKNKSKPVEKRSENGHVGSANKPQAVVKPLKQEKKSASVTQEVVKKPKVSSDDIEDLSSGDWVTVVSDRAKKALKAKQTTVQEDKPLKEEVIPPTNTSKDEKKGKKQEKKQADSLNKRSKREINEATQLPLTESREQVSNKVEQKSASSAPVATIEVLDWTAEEPEEFKKEDISKAQKKRASKNSKEAVKKLESQISRESIVLPPPQPQASQATSIITLDDKPAPKDKITNEILAQYDSAPINKKDAKKSNNKKADNNKVSKEQTPKKADSSTSTSKAKAATAPKGKPQDNKKQQAAPKKASPATTKTEQPHTVEAKVVEPPPSQAASSGASGSTDVTDTTESDPSEGEFKVVQKKRKPRRE